MQYMLMIYGDESEYTRLSKTQVTERTAAYMAFMQALTQAGVAKGAARLQPSSNATTVRPSDGKPQVLNGPYAESREQFGGYFIIDVPDLDAAISWAARCPAAQHGVVEVRPIMQMPAT